MDEFLEVFGPARLLGGAQILIGILISFVLSLAIATVYRWTYQGLSYSRSFVHTMVLGGVAARLGGAPVATGAARVAFWGVVAMVCTALVGRLFGTAVS